MDLHGFDWNRFISSFRYLACEHDYNAEFQKIGETSYSIIIIGEYDVLLGEINFVGVFDETYLLRVRCCGQNVLVSTPLCAFAVFYL